MVAGDYKSLYHSQTVLTFHPNVLGTGTKSIISKPSRSITNIHFVPGIQMKTALVHDLGDLNNRKKLQNQNKKI